MGWLTKLFGGGTQPSQQATCVKLDGAYVIDLRPLANDVPRALRAIPELAKQIDSSPQPIQVWVVGTPLLEAVGDHMSEFVDVLFDATKNVQPKMIVEKNAPEGPVYLMRSLGFEVFLPGLKLTMDGGGEIDPLVQLDRIAKAPRLNLNA